MSSSPKNPLAPLAPILGAGAVGACPLCWLGSASLLTYLGLGALIPVWRWVIALLLALSLVGFAFDYRSHRDPYPLLLLIVGGVLLYLGRYVFGGAGFGGWQIWAPGAVTVIVAVVFNKRQFSKKSGGHHHE
ncbi:hypothetical protein HYW35_01730 [Candidatus Saccharibacteria bacterium]|nr:hypothetical protein [Candidatus Saccharibacteria bacterium]